MSVKLSDFKRIVVAVDPATTSGDDADETGIVVVAQGPHIELSDALNVCKAPNCSKHGYVLDDRSGKYTPDGWANVVKAAYEQWGADRIVAEGNQGGEMVESTVRTVFPNAPFKRVHATQGKRTRAEPVAALYEQGKCHHVGSFPILEDQLTTWTIDSKESPDRLDALVWGLTELGLAKFAGGREYVEAMATECKNCAMPNTKGALRCVRCNAELPIDAEPEIKPEAEPTPFSLTSGLNVPTNYDSHTRAVMDAIQQFGPQRWQPFPRR